MELKIYWIPGFNGSYFDDFGFFSNTAAVSAFPLLMKFEHLKGSSDFEHLGLEKFFSHIVGVFQIDFFKTLYFVLSWCIMEMIFFYVSQ